MSHLSLTVEIKDTLLHDMVCYEPVNMQVLDKLLRSDLLKDNIKNPIAQRKFTTEGQQLKAYRKLINNEGLAVIRYKKPAGKKYGRSGPPSGVGLYPIRRQIRHSIAKDTMVDIDVKNCHPVLIRQLCDANYIRCDNLVHYIDNRDKILSDIQTHYLANIENPNERRDEAKTLMIRIGYLGSFNKWLKEHNETRRLDAKSLNKFLDDYSDELKNIGEQLQKYNPKVVKQVNDHKDEGDYVESSVFSITMQQHESNILAVIIRVFMENGVIVDNKCSPAADGVMVPRKTYRADLLRIVEQTVKDELGFEISLVEKEMNEDYLSILDSHILDIDSTEDVEDKDYEVIKSEFEKTRFKLLAPVSFLEEVDTEEVVVRRCKQTFYTAYENIQMSRVTKKRGKITNIKQVSFLDKWFKDPSMRTYTRAVYAPMNPVAKGEYQLFKGYAAEKIVPTKVVDVKQTHIWKHWHTIIGSEEHADYVHLRIAAHIQNPMRKASTAFILMGTQGVAKTSLIRWMGEKVFGSCVVADKPDELFGKFNSCIDNKLVCVYDEINPTDFSRNIDNIKTLITEPSINIQRKGMEPYKANNVGLWFFICNNGKTLKVEDGDRRFCAFKSIDTLANNREYLSPIYKEYDDPDIARAFFDYWMSLDVSGYDFVANRPNTEYYQSLKVVNRSPLCNFLADLLLSCGDECKELSYPVGGLFDKFIEAQRSQNITSPYSQNLFGVELKGFGDTIRKVRTNKGFKHIIDVRGLTELMVSKGWMDDPKSLEWYDSPLV